MASRSAFEEAKLPGGYLVTPRVPQGLAAAVEGLTREVIRHAPKDIYVFAAHHFEKLLHVREGCEASVEKSHRKGRWDEERNRALRETSLGLRMRDVDRGTSDRTSNPIDQVGWSLSQTAKVLKRHRSIFGEEARRVTTDEVFQTETTKSRKRSTRGRRDELWNATSRNETTTNADSIEGDSSVERRSGPRIITPIANLSTGNAMLAKDIKSELRKNRMSSREGKTAKASKHDERNYRGDKTDTRVLKSSVKTVGSSKKPGSDKKSLENDTRENSRLNDHPTFISRKQRGKSRDTSRLNEETSKARTPGMDKIKDYVVGRFATTKSLEELQTLNYVEKVQEIIDETGPIIKDKVDQLKAAFGESSSVRLGKNWEQLKRRDTKMDFNESSPVNTTVDALQSRLTETRDLMESVSSSFSRPSRRSRSARSFRRSENYTEEAFNSEERREDFNVFDNRDNLLETRLSRTRDLLENVSSSLSKPKQTKTNPNKQKRSSSAKNSFRKHHQESSEDETKDALKNRLDETRNLLRGISASLGKIEKVSIDDQTEILDPEISGNTDDRTKSSLPAVKSCPTRNSSGSGSRSDPDNLVLPAISPEAPKSAKVREHFVLPVLSSSGIASLVESESNNIMETKENADFQNLGDSQTPEVPMENVSRDSLNVTPDLENTPQRPDSLEPAVTIDEDEAKTAVSGLEENVSGSRPPTAVSEFEDLEIHRFEEDTLEPELLRLEKSTEDNSDVRNLETSKIESSTPDDLESRLREIQKIEIYVAEAFGGKNIIEDSNKSRTSTSSLVADSLREFEEEEQIVEAIFGEEKNDENEKMGQADGEDQEVRNSNSTSGKMDGDDGNESKFNGNNESRKNDEPSSEKSTFHQLRDHSPEPLNYTYVLTEGSPYDIPDSVTTVVIPERSVETPISDRLRVELSDDADIRVSLISINETNRVQPEVMMDTKNGEKSFEDVQRESTTRIDDEKNSSTKRLEDPFGEFIKPEITENSSADFIRNIEEMQIPHQDLDSINEEAFEELEDNGELTLAGNTMESQEKLEKEEKPETEKSEEAEMVAEISKETEKDAEKSEEPEIDVENAEKDAEKSENGEKDPKKSEKSENPSNSAVEIEEDITMKEEAGITSAEVEESRVVESDLSPEGTRPEEVDSESSNEAKESSVLDEVPVSGKCENSMIDEEDTSSETRTAESSNEVKETTLTDGPSLSIDQTRPFVPELNLDSLQDITVSSFKMTEEDYENQERGESENTNSITDTLTSEENNRAGNDVPIDERSVIAQCHPVSAKSKLDDLDEPTGQNAEEKLEVVEETIVKRQVEAREDIFEKTTAYVTGPRENDKSNENSEIEGKYVTEEKIDRPSLDIKNIEVKEETHFSLIENPYEIEKVNFPDREEKRDEEIEETNIENNSNEIETQKVVINENEKIDILESDRTDGIVSPNVGQETTTKASIENENVEFVEKEENSGVSCDEEDIEKTEVTYPDEITGSEKPEEIVHMSENENIVGTDDAKEIKMAHVEKKEDEIVEEEIPETKEDTLEIETKNAEVSKALSSEEENYEFSEAIGSEGHPMPLENENQELENENKQFENENQELQNKNQELENENHCFENENQELEIAKVENNEIPSSGRSVVDAQSSVSEDAAKPEVTTNDHRKSEASSDEGPNNSEDETKRESTRDGSEDSKLEEEASSRDLESDELILDESYVESETPIGFSRSASQCTTRRMSSANIAKLREDPCHDSEFKEVDDCDDGSQDPVSLNVKFLEVRETQNFEISASENINDTSNKLENVGDEIDETRTSLSINDGNKEYHVYVPQLDETTNDSTIESSDTLDSAVTKIQAGVRGFLVRRRFHRGQENRGSTLGSIPSIQDSEALTSPAAVASRIDDIASDLTNVRRNIRGYEARKRLKREDAVQRVTISLESPFAGSGLRHTGEFHDCIALPIYDYTTGASRPMINEVDEIEEIEDLRDGITNFESSDPTEESLNNDKTKSSLEPKLFFGSSKTPLMTLKGTSNIAQLVNLVVTANEEAALQTGYLNFITSVEDTEMLIGAAVKPDTDSNHRERSEYDENLMEPLAFSDPPVGVIIEEITSSDAEYESKREEDCDRTGDSINSSLAPEVTQDSNKNEEQDGSSSKVHKGQPDNQKNLETMKRNSISEPEVGNNENLENIDYKNQPGMESMINLIMLPGTDSDIQEKQLLGPESSVDSMECSVMKTEEKITSGTLDNPIDRSTSKNIEKEDRATPSN